jgi:mRNA interferase HigB
MRVISRQKIIEFTKLHGSSLSALDAWYRIIKRNNFSSFQDLRGTFPSADKVVLENGSNLTVFNIAGNNLRLIAAIHYQSQILYIRHILTHAEYDKNKWKNK